MVFVGRGDGRSRSILWWAPTDSPLSIEAIVEDHKKKPAICGKAIEKIKKIYYTDK